jgi:hypothetical protein
MALPHSPAFPIPRKIHRDILLSMNRQIVMGLLGSVAASSLAAQAVTACGGQLVPLKPPALYSCSTATPVCATDANGVSGHWVWGCPAAQQPTAQTDSSIPLRGIQPHIMTPAEAAMEIEKLRALRLQNQQMQQQIDLLQRQQLSTETPVSTDATSVEVPPPDGTNWRVMKDFEKSMELWHTIKPKGKFQKESERALDRFYSNPANLSVSISDAFLKVGGTIK